jgi:hypothetical protein
MAWAPASTCPRLLSSTCRRLCRLVAGEPTPANADRTTAIKRDRSRCRLLTKRSFVDRCVGDTTAWRKVLCHGEYRCRGARGRAKATSWNAGGFGGYSNGRGGSARFPRRLDAGHRCAPLGGGPAVHSGGRTLPSTVANTLPRRNRNRQAGTNYVPFFSSAHAIAPIGEMRGLQPEWWRRPANIRRHRPPPVDRVPYVTPFRSRTSPAIRFDPSGE